MTTSGMHRRPFEGRHLVTFYNNSFFFISFRLRVTRGRPTKNCTELNGGLIYEDLPSAPPPIVTPVGRPPPRYKPPLPPPHIPHMRLAERGLHLYTPEPHSGHHRYHSISSGEWGTTRIYLLLFFF